MASLHFMLLAFKDITCFWNIFLLFYYFKGLLAEATCSSQIFLSHYVLLLWKWVSTVVHCKEKMRKIWNKYSQKRNIGASVPISTFMCLWANYIIPRWVCLFCWRKYVPGPILGIYKSLTDTWMWKSGLRPRYSQKRNI
jgi:hypothetical protein